MCFFFFFAGPRAAGGSSVVALVAHDFPFSPVRVKPSMFAAHFSRAHPSPLDEIRHGRAPTVGRPPAEDRRVEPARGAAGAYGRRITTVLMLDSRFRGLYRAIGGCAARRCSSFVTAARSFRAYNTQGVSRRRRCSADSKTSATPAVPGLRTIRTPSTNDARGAVTYQTQSTRF